MPELQEAVERARERLDRLNYYAVPVDVSRLRVVVAPWFFRIPGFRRYTGYAFWRTIVLKRSDVSDDLLTHELCHIWQGQHRPWHLLFTCATSRYSRNPYELEARRAAAVTRSS